MEAWGGDEGVGVGGGGGNPHGPPPQAHYPFYCQAFYVHPQPHEMISTHACKPPVTTPTSTQRTKGLRLSATPNTENLSTDHLPNTGGVVKSSTLHLTFLQWSFVFTTNGHCMTCTPKVTLSHAAKKITSLRPAVASEYYCVSP